MKKTIRLVCLVLVMCMIVAVPVSAESNDNSRASAFFAMHGTSLEKTGTYQFKIWFDVIANAAIMDEIGVSEIILYRSPDNETWAEVMTYTMDDYPEMIAEDTTSHSGYLTYSNATGKYYKAYVTFYAKNSTGTGKIFRYTTTLQMR